MDSNEDLIIAEDGSDEESSVLGNSSEDTASKAANFQGEDGGELELSDAEIPLSAVVSAVIFSNSRPVSLKVLMKATGREEEELLLAVGEVKGLFSPEVHGFSLLEVSGGYQFRSAVGAAGAIRNLLGQKTRRLSRAAAETLAIIAYKQPVQRAEIEAIRGVDALPTIKTLLEMKLIRIVGNDDAIGHPALYGTTDLFLERFGLKDLEDLPSERELELLELEPGESGEEELEVADETTLESDEELDAETSESVN